MTSRLPALPPALLAMLLACAAWTGPVVAAEPAAKVIYVDASASGANNGSSWPNAYTQLACALAAAQSGDQVWVADGVYYPDEGCGQLENNITSAFVINAGVSVYGGFAGGEATLGARNPAAHLAILSGDIDSESPAGVDAKDVRGVTPDADGIRGSNALHVVLAIAPAGNVRLDGFLVTGGSATGNASQCSDGCGGGFYGQDSSATLANLEFVGNRASFGGGLLVRGPSTVTLTQVKFVGNYASSNGGGLQAQQGAAIVASNLRFERNRAGSGGAALFYATTVAIDTADVVDNRASSGAGGGLYVWETQATLNGVAFTGNRAKLDGGAVYATGANLRIDAGSIAGSLAEGSGGGLAAIGGELSVSSTTFERNRGYLRGGALFATDGVVRVSRTIVERNSTTGYGGGFYANGPLAIANVMFRGNLAAGDAGGKGGALYHSAGVLDAANITVVGNNSSIGAFTVEGLQANLNDCTFAYNASSSSAAFMAYGTTTRIRNSIFWGNGSNGGIGQLNAQIVTKASLIEGPAAGPDADGNLRSPVAPFARAASPGPDGLFGDFIQTPDDSSLDDDYGDLHLLPGAVAVDAGRNSELPADLLDIDGDGNVGEPLPFDLDGFARVATTGSGAAVVDMGALERQPPDSPTKTPTPAATPATPAPTKTPIPGQTPRAYLPTVRR